MAAGLVTAGSIALVTGRWTSKPLPPASPPPRLPVEAALEVEWGGCAEVQLRQGSPVCVIGEGAVLQLWVDEPWGGAVEVVVDDAVVAAQRYAIEGEPGGGLRVPIPMGASSLALRPAGAPTNAVSWSLALGPAPADPPPRASRQAKIEIHRALAQGDAEAVERSTERALELALDEGRLSQAVDLGLAVAFEMTRRRLDLEVAADVLRRVEQAARRYPKGRGDFAAYRGLHLWYRGATQEAAESLRDATRHAIRLEDAALAADSIPIYAETLAQLGYFEDARRWAREGLRLVRERHPCELGSALRTVGWINLQLERRGRPHDDPVPFLVESLQIFGPDGSCPRPDKVGGARSSLALIALDQGRLDQAAAELARIDRAVLSLDEQVQVEDVDLRLALARGELARARQAYQRLQRGVEAADTTDARWRLHTRRGRLLEREGDGPRAVDAYHQAEAELDTLVRLQAVGIGRGAQADRYHESTEALVSLLVDRGELGEAWCIVRQDQARRRTATMAPSVLQPGPRAELEQTIEEYRRTKLRADALAAEAPSLPRDEMQARLHAAAGLQDRARELVNTLTKALGHAYPRCTELSPPGTGELLLGLYPREDDWLVFTSDHTGTRAHAIPTPQQKLDGFAATLFDRIGPRLDAAQRVRVLAHRQAQPIDVHGLSWRGAPLGAHLPVSYGVELPVRSTTSEPGRRALLVADPTGTLQRAEAEVALVADHLTAAGWSTTVISAGTALAPGTVSLAGHDLLHYAGHAKAGEPRDHGWPPYEGGVAGWAGFLELGPAGRLTVHDVMATDAVPRAAVLAGCRTGVLELDAGRTSLALAFLAAGSEQVVASAEAIGDARGAQLARRLYEALVRAPDVDLAVAMQRAQQESWEAGDGVVGYRVWVR